MYSFVMLCYVMLCYVCYVIYAYMYVCCYVIYAYMYVCMLCYICIRMYVCMYVCMYVYMYEACRLQLRGKGTSHITTFTGIFFLFVSYRIVLKVKLSLVVTRAVG